MTKGKSIESVVAITIHIISKKHGKPISLKELAINSETPKKKIQKNYKKICKALNLKITPAKPVDYAPRFANMLGVSTKTELMAIKIIEKSIKNGIASGRNPNVIAASAIYLAARYTKERCTQKQIAKKIRIAESVIGARAHEMEIVLKDLGILKKIDFRRPIKE